ncbi:helicase [bacterium M00.F.Ca.ET.228.01.1.1]|uniref:DEAD/DEAH box helicase n=1 Tax=Paraburkholderia phenoliruptrix TaxID=252970 RepID=UPI001091CE5A|nr:DEAD/DEAH box helicase [Paraburkholderia phenoliruptrix]TGP39792.1 helicase [bacterium M00.F.Ca.ET.228.01.1.1]TGR95653.1 helicase [bacterium M00.F.Ca.ET.191.01.1.1]TGT96669.1 helicase [bacterium M00.F.Ca.ET.155.01.1.1]MBW0451044.1 DEAD/DEAH box helicase family protein [Paraburkholderia phenoliruptrix]MBW9101971.1 DEAD/DEAH box helicase family protein [Paraburkholderia phenoliruptrix]
MSSVFFDRERIADWLGDHTVAKARAVGPVSNVQWHGATLTGRVQGSEPEPYRTRVRFRTDGGTPWAQSDCSCPVGRNCKHVAALLLAELEYHDEMDHIVRVDDAERDDSAPTAEPGTPESFGPRQTQQGVRPELVSWLERFRARAEAADAAAQKATAARTETLAYRLNWSDFHKRHEVVLYRARCDANGRVVEVGETWGNVESALLKQPRFVSDEDLSILRGLWLGRAREDFGQFVLRGTNGAEMLQKLIVTGRLFFDFKVAPHDDAPTPLVRAADRPGRIEWEPLADQRLRPVLCTEPRATMVLPTEPVWYVDGVAKEAGIVRSSLPFQQLPDYLAMPPISLAEAPLVASVLREVAPDLPLPPTPEASAIRVIDVEPVPVLTLNSHALPFAARTSKATRAEKASRATRAAAAPAVELAGVSFDYDGVSINVDSSVTLVPVPGGEVLHIRRRYEVEKKRLLELRKTGLQKVPTSRVFATRLLPDTMLGLPDDEAWSVFVNEAVPDLVSKGWRVTMAPEFRYNVIEIDAIDGTAHQAGDGWFDLEMGIRIGERSVRLEPLLADLFRRDRRWLGGALEAIPDDEPIELKTEENKRLRLRADRLKPVVRVLVDLFDSLGGALAEGAPLRVPSVDAGRLEALNDTGRWQFRGDDSIRQLAARLQAGPGLREVPVPAALRAQLRAYQQQGLNWMQYLREQGLAGVLADDMGLGKTVQTLAHILAEREAGRLDKPALIVVPTTLVHNWREEARRFAPELKVLVLNGPQRKERFEQIGEHELILTTYALLWRDQKVLAGHEYHLLILDEAQYVKNATTKAAQAIRGLSARHRLCLTGTPLENHLGELWSQFDFLLPGFLGTQKDFTRRWRNPIEKNHDGVRRSLLARRIRPFMLRRRKDEVAKELPAKTTIVCSVDLEGAQRDLYETVRTAMQERVRAAVSAQGLARSHIIVLDALLKLRQVCCDPRLVRSLRAAEADAEAQGQAGVRADTHAGAQALAQADDADARADVQAQANVQAHANSNSNSNDKTPEDSPRKLSRVSDKPEKPEKGARPTRSAKLDLLLSMLPELIEEGRRVLLFSQFTGMLSLIAQALDEAAIAYVILTGDTADRITPVQRFQQGEVPLFLISLKAGGVGLNLTAADTVIHYDPWWNPAAENQATDRAHRLGQDKPVFVYKLIAAGSIEEKIVELQEQKAGLADSILSEDAAGAVKFSDDDIDALFAPMPELDGEK